LVGGIAVSFRSRERFTKDVDFAVSVTSDAEAEALAGAFQRAGYRLAQVFENTAQVSLRRFAFLFLVDHWNRCSTFSSHPVESRLK
jgi:hypothetical protein